MVFLLLISEIDENLADSTSILIQLLWEQG